MSASSPASYKSFLRPSGVRLRKIQFHSFLIGLILLLPQIASAAVFSVTTLTDDPTDPGSLRSAVNLVNAGSGGDTINFSGFSGDDKMITLTGTITLNSTLTVSKSVTINGPGANPYGE